jgi:hypothetical protein
VNTAAGCKEVIGADDPCFQGAADSKETVVCHGYVLTNDDLCWYHAKNAYGNGHGGYTFIGDKNMVSLEGLVKFVQEATASNNVRFLGQEVSADLLVAMRKEIKKREATRAVDLKLGAVVGFEQASNPFLHEQVLFLL